MSTSAANFKVVFNLKELNTSQISQDNIEVRLKIYDKDFQVHLRELISCEVNDLNETPLQLTFQDINESKSLGSIEIELPKDISQKEEFELGNTFKINSETPLEGSYFLVVFNRTLNLKKLASGKIPLIGAKKLLLKPDPASLYSPKGNELKKSVSGGYLKPAGTNSPKGQVMTPDKYKTMSLFSSSTRDRSQGKPYSAGSRIKKALNSSGNRGNSANKSKIMEILANDVKSDGINRAINRSIESSSKWIENLEKDKKAINDCLYLNSLKNDSEAPNLEGLDLLKPNEVVKSGLEVIIDKKELTKQPYELSPMKLKSKFEEKAAKAKTFQVDTLKNQLQDFTTEQKNQTDYLKLVVLALDTKLKSLMNVDKDNELLKMELNKSEEIRTELEKALRDANNQAKLDQMANQTIFNRVLEEKHLVDEKLKELTKLIEKSGGEKGPSVSLENEIREARINLKNYEEIRKNNMYLKGQIENKEKKIQDLNELLTQKSKEFYQVIHDIEEQRDNIFKEKMQLSSELNETKLKLESEKNKTKEMSYEIDGLKSKIEALALNDGLLKQAHEDRRRVEEELKETRLSLENQNSIIEKLKVESIGKLRESDDEGKRIIERAKVLEQKILALEVQNNEKNNQITSLQKQLFDVNNENKRLEKQFLIKQSQNSKIEDLKDREDKLIQENQDYRSQIALLSDQVMLQNNKTFDLENSIKELKNSIVEREEYNLNLKKLVLEMREKEGQYIPFKDDAIDRKLANFIANVNDPARLRIMFVREGEGVYQFGTKRVHVKIEQDKIFIRVGGGYISVEEFLDIYTPIELEKMMKNNPVSILSKNIAVNNVLAGRCVKEIDRTKNVQLKEKSTGLVLSQDK